MPFCPCLFSPGGGTRSNECPSAVINSISSHTNVFAWKHVHAYTWPLTPPRPPIVPSSWQRAITRATANPLNADPLPQCCCREPMAAGWETVIMKYHGNEFGAAGDWQVCRLIFRSTCLKSSQIRCQDERWHESLFEDCADVRIKSFWPLTLLVNRQILIHLWTHIYRPIFGVVGSEGQCFGFAIFYFQISWQPIHHML